MKSFGFVYNLKECDMVLRGIRFHYAFDQSGVRNFDGSGWPYHKYFKHFGLTFQNCTFVAKTATLKSRMGAARGEPGNLELKPDGLTPLQARPDCIAVNHRHGVALNAVGLSGPGLKAILESGWWYQQREPFMISLMSLSDGLSQKTEEITAMARMIKPYMPFSSPFAVQLNISCPNVAHEPQKADAVLGEVRLSLHILRQHLGDLVPLVIKVNALLDMDVARAMSEDYNLDAISNSNTIPWSDVPSVDQVRLFGSTESPLAKYGGGGLSGAYLLPMVGNWVLRARSAGIQKPIIAGGGILHPRDVDYMVMVGASAVALGSVAFLRPWRVQRIINRINAQGDAHAFV